MAGDTSFVHSADFDQFQVETPEQVDLRFPVAGLGSRFLAALLDVILIFLTYLLLLWVADVTRAARAGVNALDRQTSTAQNWWAAAFVLLNFLLVWGYFSLTETFWNGQTIGKRVLKIRAIKNNGRAMTGFEAMARNLLRAVDWLPGIYLVGVITMMCTKGQKRLGDLVAGTIVVHERTDEQPLLVQSQSRTITAAVFADAESARKRAPDPRMAAANGLPADAVARLGPADLNLMETFFGRALDLTVERRALLAERVAATICIKMGIPRPDGMNAERLIETVAYRMRGQGRF
jgi:uncharacterized RDD family membrane protein YckC